MEKTTYQPGTIVTIDLKNDFVSNTYFIHKDLGETVLLSHPLFPTCLLEVNKEELDKTSPIMKDSIERNLIFANNFKEVLDFNSIADLEALCLYFVIKRQLTPRQKNILSSINGKIASLKFYDNLQEAMNFIKKNSALLDDFNTMWFNNFKGLFSGEQQITSPKQRSAIFNMAGFLLAEVYTQKVIKEYKK